MTHIKIEYEMDVDGYPGGGTYSIECPTSWFIGMSRQDIDAKLEAIITEDMMGRVKYHCEAFDQVVEQIQGELAKEPA